MKLGLGTVQFGLDYGISNRDGRTCETEVRAILEAAEENGVRVLDTAPAYGTSEQVLGALLRENHPFDIVSKTAVVPESVAVSGRRQYVVDAAKRSLERMAQTSIYGLLVHHPTDLIEDGGEEVFEALVQLRDRGLVRRIGASVYTPDEARAIASRYEIDLMQLPINVFNQAFESTGTLSFLAEKGIEIHARSVFLQGLLLMTEQEVPPALSKLRQHVCEYRRHIDSQGLSPLSAALGFVASLDHVDCFLCGVNNLAQFEEIVVQAECVVPTGQFRAFACDDKDLVNPAKWSR